MTDIFIGASNHNPNEREDVSVKLKYLTRHGLIAGATGTGKTVSLQILAEQLSENGVPVFVSDVKGDLSGLAAKSASEDFLVKRANIIGLEPYEATASPVAFWDLHQKQGHPLRTTLQAMGPLLLGRVLELNDTQSGVLAIAYQYAADEKLPLLDLKDLRALLQTLGENKTDIANRYGFASSASIGSVQRRLLQLEQQGAAQFFGEPALDVQDFLRTDANGRGMINLLAADKLMATPRLYSTFLLWLLNELFATLPEAGETDKPKLVFFFDEAHLLFTDAPKALLEQVEQVVKLIRSKGVGVFFVTQNPQDIPEGVLAQLGCKIQHALRAFTPKAQKDLKLAAQTFRPNPNFKTLDTLTQMGVGEALVSSLEKKGIPGIVQQTLIRPPSSKLGPITPAARKKVMTTSAMGEKYDEAFDRESAHEILTANRKLQAKKAAELEKLDAKKAAKPKAAKSRRQSKTEAFMKSLLRTFGTTLAREILKLVKAYAQRR